MNNPPQCILGAGAMPRSDGDINCSEPEMERFSVPQLGSQRIRNTLLITLDHLCVDRKQD